LPIVLGARRPQDGASTQACRIASAKPNASGKSTTRCLEIGLVNNMPDAALEATERQFADLLGAAADRQLVRLHLFSLPQLPRGEATSAYLELAYAPIDKLGEARLDALIVTGTEPRAPSLDREPYWDALSKVIDWAEHNTISTIWSCLAAHAAVLHLDGVHRHELKEKCFGVFDCEPVADDPMLVGAPSPSFVTHARCNELRESELVSHGYRILTRSQAGVDMFAKQWRSLFLFFQGHPEYELDSLAREYRRDMSRFLRGENRACPPMPQGYFDTRSEEVLTAFTARALGGPDADLLASFPEDLRVRPALVESWRAPAVSVLRNWLSYIAERKA
jgi:homoserine O-succinyltransferase